MEEQIIKVIQRYEDLFSRGDVTGLLELFDEYVVVMEPDVETIIGRDALRASFEKFLANASIDLSFFFHNILLRGTIATVVTSGEGTIMDLESRETVPFRARELWVLTIDKEWKIRQYMFQMLPVGGNTTPLSYE